MVTGALTCLRLVTISGQSGSHVTVIMKWSFPCLSTIARASLVSVLGLAGDPWEKAGSNLPGVCDVVDYFLERFKATPF